MQKKIDVMGRSACRERRFRKSRCIGSLYAKLKEQQIADKLSKVAGSRPTSASPAFRRIRRQNKLSVVADKGPALTLSFKASDRLRWRRTVEDDGIGALGWISRFSSRAHNSPDTQRGYAVVMNKAPGRRYLNCGSADIKTIAKICGTKNITAMWSDRANRRRRLAI